MSPDPSPSPVADQEFVDVLNETLAGSILVLVLIAVIIAIVAFIVLRSARHPLPTGIIMSLTVLGTIALIGYAVGGENRPELAAIAGTAVGALAGGVAALVTSENRSEEE